MRKKNRPVSNINVTPMVDVMLVLLIVFMVTAPLLTVGVPDAHHHGRVGHQHPRIDV